MNKRSFFRSFLAVVAAVSLSNQAFSQSTAPKKLPYQDVTVPIDLRVKDLVSRMTLEEKIGQMTQVNITTLTGGYREPVKFEQADLEKIILKYHIGSVLNCVVSAADLKLWALTIKTIQDVAMKDRLQIPVIYGLDGVHGAGYVSGATLFPTQLGLAATRNTDLAFKMGQVTAAETRSAGTRWNFAPVLDVSRQPLWSRFPETFGEDVHIVTKMGLAVVKGSEGTDVRRPESVASCLKHFLGYGSPTTGKDRSPALLPEMYIREYYLPPFKAAIEAGAKSIMVNSGEINGVPVHASKAILTDLLRKELGFKGMIVTDWKDIEKMYTVHKVAPSLKEAICISVNAGIDMSMLPEDIEFCTLLKELVNEGKVSHSRIDDAVSHVLKLKFEVGLFENPYVEAEAVKNFGKPEYKQYALDAAHESITLLKNADNVLPLAKGKKVLVAGPAANLYGPIHGCWSYTWMGVAEQHYPKTNPTILQAIQNKIGKENVLSFQGAKFDSLASDFAAAVEAAKKADYVVLCLGENGYAEGTGDINDLELNEKQQQLATAFAAVGKPVILVLAQGRPRIIRKIEPEVKGILMAYWPGSQGGQAIADILFGDYNPDGILPFTYPRHAHDLETYDHKYSEALATEDLPPFKVIKGHTPQYPFGFGLSYTTFAYSDLKLSTDTLKGSQKLKVSVTVKNTGAKDGKVALELYSSDLYASITPSVRRLRAFTKVSIAAGKSTVVEFEIDKNDLAFVNAENKTVTETGDFTISIGDQKKNLYYKD